MADRTVRVIVTGSSAGAVKAFGETALASDAAGDDHLQVKRQDVQGY